MTSHQTHFKPKSTLNF